MKFFAFLLGALLMVSCANSKASKDLTGVSEKEQHTDSLIARIMGTDNFTELHNADSTFVLYYSDISEREGEAIIKIVVIEADKDVPLYEYTARNATVSWSGIENIIVEEALGVSTPTDNGRKMYKIHVKTGKKELLKNLQNE